MSSPADTKLLRHAPADWLMGLTRVLCNADGRHGTFVRNSQPLPGTDPSRWLGVLVRFDGERDLVDVDPADLTVTCLRDPFAAISASLPTRYAPGATGRPYDYLGPALTWFPVIYYPDGDSSDDEGPIWLVEPYPAERADGTDRLDPIISAGITVVRGDAAPRPRHADPDGDWILPATSPAGDVAYEVHVTNQRDALAAWIEAWAIAAALNDDRLLYQIGLDIPQDIPVLLAAERRVLTWNPPGPGLYREITDDPDEAVQVVPADHMSRLAVGTWATIQPIIRSDKTGLIDYGLSSAGVKALTAIRRHGADHGGPRCRECGCTDDRACDGGCSWLTLTDPAGPLCSACPTSSRRR
jgi:hypothetical protein